MKTKAAKLRFDLSGYYFFGLVFLVLLGFWPSYFTKFFNGTADFSFYFHFHAGVLILWMSLLILLIFRIKSFISKTQILAHYLQTQDLFLEVEY